MVKLNVQKTIEKLNRLWKTNELDKLTAIVRKCIVDEISKIETRKRVRFVKKQERGKHDLEKRKDEIMALLASRTSQEMAAEK